MTPSNLFSWATAVGALSRIKMFNERMNTTEKYIDRLRLANDILGPNWAFRLRDIVGDETIIANRPSWYDFYVKDVDGLHLPLDPGAPETSMFLGPDYSAKDMAFYAGMGFDGYCLALRTQRIVLQKQKSILFDDKYIVKLPAEIKLDLQGHDVTQHIPKEKYYREYGLALDSIYSSVEQILSSGKEINSAIVERTVAACLILLCGGHQGCTKHISSESEFNAQMDSLIIFNASRLIASGQINLEDCLLHENVRDEVALSGT